MEKSAFLEFLADELKAYHLTPIQLAQEKSEKKQYLNGLMKASRFFGVTFDELQKVTNATQENVTNVDVQQVQTSEDYFYIPTFIRNKQ